MYGTNFRRIRSEWSGWIGLALAAGAALAGTGRAGAEVSYYTQIRPIFQANCQGCHQPAKDKGGYVMTEFERLTSGGDSEQAAIVASDPEQSLLFKMITPVNGEAEMPRKRDPLSEGERELIRQWIAEGAKDDSPVRQGPSYDMDHPPEYKLPPIVTSIDFSPDGALLAVAGFHEVLLHRTDGSGLAGRLVGLSERIESVQFSPDGRQLAVTGGLPARMGEVQVWDVARQRLELSVPVTYDTVYGASWSPDGKLIAFGCSDRTVRAIEASSGKEVLFQGSHDDWVLDTVFSLQGDHVVSAGRDRTAKLTEVATQRFIDNITSITPGALKGGIQSVERHPERDEILVGGADGTPQIYRVFRETKRVIGDNANLIRHFPEMRGRIFGVDYRSDGKRIVAGSSLDSAGAVHIYASEFDSSLSEDLKKILEKTTGSRSEEEERILEEYRTKGVELMAAAPVPAAVYAVSFHPGGEFVAAAGSDGVVRFLDAETGSLRKAFLAAPVESFDPETIIGLSVSPTRVELEHPYDYVQMLVTGWTAGGELRDLTREAELEVAGGLGTVEGQGVVRPARDGESRLQVRVAGQVAEVPVRIQGMAEPYVPDYILDVMPVISKMGCNAGTCHGAKDGKNGFKLSLRGYDPIFDVRAFTDDLAGRRVNFASPDDSLMLLKATGAVPHEGGQRTTFDSHYYQIVRDWIGQGAKLDLDRPRVKRIELEPKDPVVEKIGTEQQVRVVAVYEDGRKRDVTQEAFVESGNGEVATASEGGVVQAIRRGEAPILARFEGAYAATTLTVMGDRAGFVWEEPEVYNPIDEFVAAKWKKLKIAPSGVCTDAEFIRRVYLDLTGLPPSADAVRAFMEDGRESREKRDALVDELIGNDGFVEYWANKWADLLQVNGKFLGREGASLFREWIEQAVQENRPYDQFVRTILTASGSNRENPPASYYKILREPEEIMENTTHLFLGTRFNCNKCHDHPFERWTQDQYYEMAAFFGRVSMKKDPASEDRKVGGTAVEGAKPLYEIVFDAEQGEVKHERTGAAVAPAFPFEADFEPLEGGGRRDRLASWLTSRDNPYFARSYVNRVWGYLLGVGLIEPLDDIRAGNPPSNPMLLDWLTERFVESGFDVRELMRVICKSRVYQLSIETNEWNKDDQINFSHAIPKRLPAEVLHDAIYFTVGAQSRFPGMPAGMRAVALPDAEVKLADGFLGTLGRPSRESACECERSNDLQLGSIMALVSGPTVEQAVSDPENALAALVKEKPEDERVIEELFLRILNRPARSQEIAAAKQTFEEVTQTHQEVEEDLAAYREELEPIMKEREAQRERLIAEAEAAVREYEGEIAEREAKLDREQADRVADVEMRVAEYKEGEVEKLREWEAGLSWRTEWQAPAPVEVKATFGSELAVLEDGSVLASGENGKGAYEVVLDVDAGESLTGLRLEALVDESLPKRGPGRADGDGNFVLTELEVFVATEGGEWSQVELGDAKADFSQNGYDVATAIDGKMDGSNNGWAVAPEMGNDHVAAFELKERLGLEKPARLLVKLHHQFQSGKHTLGRFRLGVTRSEPPLELGVAADVSEVLQVAAGERTEEQVELLLKYRRQQDEVWKKLEEELAEAKKPRPVDPKLQGLREKLARAQKPLGPDPKLVALERAYELSSQQVKERRLTAAQDLAWALINNPAFLFNH